MWPSGLVALQYREYRLFWLGGVFSNIGMWALIAGTLWLMRELTDSTLMLGLVTFSAMGPSLFLSVWGGVLADRVNRLKLVMATRAMFSLLAFLTGALIASNVVQPWHIVAITLGTGVLLAFDLPSRQAIVPSLVKREHLFNAIALYSLIFGGASIIGPAFFAPLIKLWGLEGLFFAVGIAYALTVGVLAMMHPLTYRGNPGQGKLWQELLAGFVYMRRHRAILSLFAIGVLAGTFGMSFRTLLPVFADEILHGGVENYSLLLLATGAGGLVGTASLAWLGKAKNSMSFQTVTGVGFGLTLALFSQIRWLPASVAVIGLVGACSAVFTTVNTTLVQSLVSEEFRGRVMSIYQVTFAVAALGGLFLGFLAQVVNAPFALTFGGLVTAFAIVTIGLPVLRRVVPEP